MPASLAVARPRASGRLLNTAATSAPRAPLRTASIRVAMLLPVPEIRITKRGRGAVISADDHLGLAGLGLVDAADHPGGFPGLVEDGHGIVRLRGGHADHHADAAVEGAVHLLGGDVAVVPERLADRRQGAAGGADGCAGPGEQQPAEV